MYLRRTTKKKGGTAYECWLLVESRWTVRGPPQRVVATIGKLPGLDHGERIGWEEIGRLLSGKPQPESGLFEQPEEPPSWAMVNISSVRVERLRHFGDVYLGLLLWNKLGLADFCREHILSGREEIPWSIMAALLALARFCAPSSELQIAESWYDKTVLDDLLGVPGAKINDDRLYRALDALLPHKDALCRHLQQRYGELFGATFDFLFYDITSTYFEGTARGNRQAKRGYSRDSRPDCPQVCIGLVASKEGLLLAFEIFDGNWVDVTTTKEMVQAMESKYGKANRVWVMDRGMVSDENLEYLRTTGARYLVGTPKSMLKKFEQHLVDQNWEEVQPGVDVKLCRSPEGTEETFVLCRAASLFTVTVKEVDCGKDSRLSLTIKRNEERCQWARESGGNYILRTNWTESDPKIVWHTYIQLTEVEESFRTEKHDLGMRPIFHHKQKRTQAHILVCFLALALWRTLQQWMKAAGLGTAPRKLLEEMRELKSLDVLLPTREKTIRLRMVATAPKELKMLLQRMKIPLPNKPQVIENVVTKMA